VCALQLQEARLSLVDEPRWTLPQAAVDVVAARLAREGGRFGDVTISLLWNDQTDLDLHVTLPSGEKIFYSNKKSACGNAELDVDMNAGGGKWSKEPVENVYAGDAEKGVEAPQGRYKVQVHNYAFHSDEGLAVPREVPFTVSVRMHGDVLEYHGTCTHASQVVDVIEFDYQGRLPGAAEQTEALQERKRRAINLKSQLSAVPRDLLQCTTELLPPGPIKETLQSEALLATVPDKFRTWGRHYLVTLPQMLRAERRSNFRDAALQSFGNDVLGHEALFAQLSTEAELCFSQLEPPVPSGLERLARQKQAASHTASSQQAGAAASAVRYSSMPDEFLRGGGCFAADALVSCVCSDGSERAVRIAEVEAGTRVRTASGGVAEVQCVVVSPCAQGEAVLSELPTGLQLTEWHPLMDAHGRWRFPITLGRRVLRRISAVYNLVLDVEHVAIVGGMACVTLGHGIEGPIVGHPFWGTRAVIDQLAQQEGWASGRVVLEQPLRAPSSPTVP